MELKVYAGKRVLYKQGSSGWKVGELKEDKAELTPSGLFLPIIPKEYIGQEEPEEIDWAELNNIFLEALPIQDWMRIYKEYYMTKEEYLDFIESEDFDKNLENAYVADGDYMYYPVSKYSRAWIEKQPFEYIVRSN